MTDRPSLPPSDASLATVAKRLSDRNDAHEAALASITTITDTQRLAIVKEIWAYFFKERGTHMDVSIGHYEAEVKARMGT